jgi:succinate dehydrogenase / fumarate reductase cytochrome b subunit
MNWISNFFVSSVGKKQLMALTGIGLGMFLIIHLSGNLLIFKGEEAFNAYAHFLESQFWLPAARIGLIATTLLHVYLAFNLTMQNRKARPDRYYHKAPSEANLASRSMIYSGVLILVYVILHLMHFTFEPQKEIDGLYNVVVAKMSSPGYGSFYILAMVVLAMHLVHAIQSAFQTFGVRHPRHTIPLQRTCVALAYIICLGFASLPIYLMIVKGGA